MTKLTMSRNDFEWIMENQKHIKLILDMCYMRPRETTVLGAADKLFSYRDIHITFDEDAILEYDLD